MSQYIPSLGTIGETREISRRGWYEKGGRHILLARAPAGSARDATAVNIMQGRGYLKDAERTLQDAPRAGEVVLCDADTLAAAQGADSTVLVMSFAHPYVPGGGFLEGRTGQEASLCRSSTLYESLTSPAAQRMYQHNARLHDKGRTQFDDYLLISPSVGVFRDRGGALLDEPYCVAAASVPSPDPGGGTPPDPQRLVSQLAWFLATGAALGYTSVVLGAWGCGYSGLDAHAAAECFAEALRDRGLARLYDRVTFALPGRHEYEAFHEVFPEASEQCENPPVDPALALVHPYLPVCNYHRGISEDDLGYVQGVMEDGTPFVAEAHMDGDAMFISFYYPYRADLSGPPEQDSAAGEDGDAAAGTAYTPDADPAGGHGAVMEPLRRTGVWHDHGSLDLGMLDYGPENSQEYIQANVQMLEDNGLIEFTGIIHNGAVHYRCDLAGQDITRTTVTLRDEELGDTAHCPLLFHPFPDSPADDAERPGPAPV